MVVMGEGGGAANVMTACTGRCLAMAGVAVTSSCGDMRIMGELTVLGCMTGVTAVVWFDNRLGTGYS